MNRRPFDYTLETIKLVIRYTDVISEAIKILSLGSPPGLSPQYHTIQLQAFLATHFLYLKVLVQLGQEVRWTKQERL